MISIQGHRPTSKAQFALGGLFLLLAGGLWLSGGEGTRAASATTTQSVSATITNSISWGTAGTCIQSTGAAAFGSLAPGASASAPGVGTYTGCVSSNATWGVTATMTTPPSSGTNTIAAERFRAEVLTTPLTASTGCAVGNSSAACTLDNGAVNLVSGAPPTPPVGTILTNGLAYSYKLNVPANQPAGTYTGGLITLTASN